jgi:hypothetical protein
LPYPDPGLKFANAFSVLIARTITGGIVYDLPQETRGFAKAIADAKAIVAVDRLLIGGRQRAGYIQALKRTVAIIWATHGS